MNIEKMNIKDIVPYANNAKEHPVWHIEQMKDSIKKYKFNTPILVDEKNIIISGNARFKALKELGHKEVPVIVIKHLNENEKIEYRVIDNKLTLNTGFDEEILKEELEKIKTITGLETVEIIGFEVEEIELALGEVTTFFDEMEKEGIGHKSLSKEMEEGSSTFGVTFNFKNDENADELKKYLKVLEKTNSVVQISLVSPKFDRIEKGCPTFEERIEMIKKISKRVKRVNIRIQPYVREAKKDILENLELYKEIGVYGITIEGMKFFKKEKNTIKDGIDFVYKEDVLKRDYLEIKNKCKEVGLKFYSAENRLRKMGDDLCCCGVDGMEGFKVNTFNLIHMFHDSKENVVITDSMKKKGSATQFKTSLKQDTSTGNYLKDKSMEEMMKKVALYKNKK